MFAALRNLETVRALGGDSAELATLLSELEQTIRRAIDETRAVMVDLRPSGLDGVGLRAALRQYCLQFEARTGIRTACTCPDGSRPCPRWRR